MSSAVHSTMHIAAVVSRFDSSTQMSWSRDLGREATFRMFVLTFGYEDQGQAEDDYIVLLRDNRKAQTVRDELLWEYHRFQKNHSREFWFARRLARQERLAEMTLRAGVFAAKVEQHLAAAAPK